MPPNQQNQYDFIMNPGQSPKRSFKFGNNMGARVAVIVGLVILLIILGTVLNSFLSKESRAQTQRLTEVAEAQAEIIRVSAQAKQNAKNAQTQNFAMNTKLSVESSQQQVKELLVKRGVGEKGLSKELAAAKNEKNDATLKEATQNNRFDETFTTLVEKQLEDYQRLLQSAYETGSPNEKKVLTSLFQNSTTLLNKPTAQNPQP